jgi:hypothetical protein
MPAKLDFIFLAFREIDVEETMVGGQAALLEDLIYDI